MENDNPMTKKDAQIIKKIQEEDAPRVEIQQAIIDDSKDENLAIATIIHRCNYLYSMVNDRNREPSRDTPKSKSFKISIAREAKQIKTLIESFFEMKLQHNESQHAILKRLMKNLKKRY